MMAWITPSGSTINRALVFTPAMKRLPAGSKAMLAGPSGDASGGWLAHVVDTGVVDAWATGHQHQLVPVPEPEHLVVARVGHVQGTVRSKGDVLGRDQTSLQRRRAVGDRPLPWPRPTHDGGDHTVGGNPAGPGCCPSRRRKALLRAERRCRLAGLVPPSMPGHHRPRTHDRRRQQQRRTCLSGEVRGLGLGCHRR